MLNSIRTYSFITSCSIRRRGEDMVSINLMVPREEKKKAVEISSKLEINKTKGKSKKKGRKKTQKGEKRKEKKSKKERKKQKQKKKKLKMKGKRTTEK